MDQRDTSSGSSSDSSLATSGSKSSARSSAHANSINNRKGLIAEFVSDTLPMVNFPYITWHLDPESLGNFKSYVTIGLWADAANFQEQVAQYFNDDKPMLSFEKYRRRRVIFEPVGWRIGETPLPDGDSPGVQ
jgi:hypothetical protein